MSILLVFLVAYRWDTNRREILQNYRTLLAGSASDVNAILFNAEQKAKLINGNSRINVFLTSRNKEDLYADFSFFKEVESMFRALQADGTIRRITVFSFNDVIHSGEFIRRISDLSIDRETRDVINGSNETRPYLWTYRDATADGRRDASLRLYSRIMSLNGNKPLAVTEIVLDFEKIMERVDFAIPEGSAIVYFVRDQNRSVIVRRLRIQPSDVEALLKDPDGKRGARYHTVKVTLPVNGDVLEMFVPRAHLLRKLTGFFLGVSLVVISMFVLVWLTAKIVSFHLTRQLTELVSRIDRGIADLNRENVDLLPSSEDDDEFRKIGVEFRRMMERIDEYYKRISAYEVKIKSIELHRKTLQLELLQAGVNPHFLYNTLSVIKYAFSDERLAMLIDSMVRYYRTALNKGKNVIRIREEVEMVGEYLKVQRFAYLLDFAFEKRIQPDIHDCLMLRHLLQPVVENAFMHGISGNGDGGLIVLRGKAQGGKILLEVEDNGVGIPRRKLDGILSAENSRGAAGYGLANVAKRIKLEYGEEYGLSIESTVGTGTRVTISIPAIRNFPDSAGDA